MTTGFIMFLGGIIGAVIMSVLVVIMIPLTKKRRRSLLEQIHKG